MLVSMHWPERIVVSFSVVVGFSAGAIVLLDAPSTKMQEAFEHLDVQQQRIEQHPEDPRVRFDYALALHRAEHLEEALDAHLLAAEHPDFRSLGYYNAGCACALLGYEDAAVHYLTLAVLDGYRDQTHWLRDRDLNPIRYRKDFQTLQWSIGPRITPPPHIEHTPGPGGWL